MNDYEEKIPKDLTPKQRATIERREFEGWLLLREGYDPPKETVGIDAVTQNPRVIKLLTRAIGYLPVAMLITLVAAIIVSLDKTSWAFERSVANTIVLGGVDVWRIVVAFAAVVMVDVALAVSEFEIVRQTLAAGKPDTRRYWTLMAVLDAVINRIGYERVRGKWRRIDPDERAQSHAVDPTVRQWNAYIFALAVIANVFSITQIAGINSLNEALHMQASVVLMIVTGIGGVISIQQIGRLVGRVTFRAAQTEYETMHRMIVQEWRAAQLALWEEEGPELVFRALHEAWTRKNGVELEAQSPYLLIAGEEASLDLVPFENTSRPLSGPVTMHQNGNGSMSQ